MIRAVLGVVLGLAALAVAVLAVQVHRLGSELRDDDLRFQVAPLSQGLWSGPGGPGSGAARRLLAVGDDVRFRKAEQLFVRVHTSQRDYEGEAQRLAAFGQAQSLLQQLGRSDPSPPRRARAANLFGILLWEDAGSAQENAPILLRQAIAAFREAVRADSAQNDAKYNLELLSTVIQPAANRRKDTPEQAGSQGFKGAGVGTSGSGY